MVGDYKNPEQRGVIPRSLEQIFEKQAKDVDEYSYEISVSFIQIYLEMIQDLIDPDNLEIRISENPSSGVFVSGVLWVPVKSV